MSEAICRTAVIALTLGAVGACVTRPPSIAHVHIGHALTGVHVTPNHKGYLLVAEQRAAESMTAARSANDASDLETLKAQVALAVAACDNDETFGVKQSLVLAANHLTFAADSADASNNVVNFAPQFKSDITAVVGRCEYLGLLGSDVATSSSLEESKATARELLKAATANVEGDDSSGSGVKGAVPVDYGVLQLREQIQSMIARERPAYRTVDEWYLFNLVRLPNGRWVFDRLGRGGNIDGYK